MDQQIPRPPGIDVDDSSRRRVAAALAATLNVTLIDSFDPSVGDIFDILTAGSVSGTFATVNLPPIPTPKVWQIDYARSHFDRSVELPKMDALLLSECGNVSSS